MFQKFELWSSGPGVYLRSIQCAGSVKHSPCLFLLLDVQLWFQETEGPFEVAQFPHCV